MFCYKCGKDIGDAKFCPYCGTPIDEMNHQGYQPIQSNNVVNENDETHIGFSILSFFIPIVGLVLFLVWNNETPKKAKGCLIGCIAGFVTDIVLIICMFCAFAGLITGDSNDPYYHDNYFNDTFNHAIVEVVPYE